METDLEVISDEEKDEEQENTKEPEVVSVSEPKKRKKSYIYKEIDDIRILQEVIMEKPAGKNATKKWQIIFNRLLLPVPTYRSIKDRFDLLFKEFKKDNCLSMKRSGTQEDFEEKTKLLTDIAEQIEDWKAESIKTSDSQKRKADDDLRKATEIREASLNTLGEAKDTDSTDPSPTQASSSKKRCRPTDFVEILKSSEKSKLDIERRRLILEERELDNKEENDRHRRSMELKQLKMEEDRIALERQRIEKDQEERKLFRELLLQNLKK